MTDIFRAIVNDPNVSSDLRRLLAASMQPRYAGVKWFRADPVRESQMHIRHYRQTVSRDPERIGGCPCRGCVLAMATLQRRKAAA